MKTEGSGAGPVRTRTALALAACAISWILAPGTAWSQHQAATGEQAKPAASEKSAAAAKAGPAAEKPAGEKPATEKPSTEKPSTEKPSGEKSAARGADKPDKAAAAVEGGKAAGRPAESKAAASEKHTATEGGEKAGAGEPGKAGKAPSLQDVAKRISAVVAEQTSRSSTEGAAKPPARPAEGAPAEGGRPRAAGVRSTPPAPKPASPVTLSWDAALSSKGVALAWDQHLDPRRSAELGVRLVWRDRPPSS
jgi:hypothetical protein